MNHSSQKTSVAMTAIAVVALGIVVGSTAVNAFLMITPAYAQLDDISGEQIIGEEIEIPDSDDISKQVQEISQSLPTLPQQTPELVL
jgi:hypothetical protein